MEQGQLARPITSALPGSTPGPTTSPAHDGDSVLQGAAAIAARGPLGVGPILPLDGNWSNFPPGGFGPVRPPLSTDADGVHDRFAVPEVSVFDRGSRSHYRERLHREGRR